MLYVYKDWILTLYVLKDWIIILYVFKDFGWLRHMFIRIESYGMCLQGLDHNVIC